MLRLFITAIACIAFLAAASLSASVYTGGPSVAGGSVKSSYSAGRLFPGVIFGDPADHYDSSGSLEAILAAVNEFFSRPSSSEQRQTVASLYGERNDAETEPEQNDANSTVPVNIGGSGNQVPINVFTGADTTKILNQLFSGILDVNDETFARRWDRKVLEPGLPAGGGRSGSSLGLSNSDSFLHENFLAPDVMVTRSRWISANPITTRVEGAPPLPPFEDGKPKKTSELLSFVLRLLNPYFYGALLLILIFSVAWSVRARISHSNEPDL